MLRFAAFLTKHLVLTVPAAMVLGFLLGMAIDPAPLKALILPLTFLMVYPMMINLKVKKLIEGGDGKVQWVTQALNFLVVPFVALGLGHLVFPNSPFLMLGLFLASLLPTSGMTISYTGLSKGNMEAAIKMTVVGLIIGSLVAPFYLQFFLGAKIHIDVLGVMGNIALIVFAPMVLGYLTQQFLIRKYTQKTFNQEIGPKVGPLSTLGVLGVVLVATALKAKAMATHPELLVQILVPLCGFYVINYTLSVFIGKTFFGRDDAIALLYGSVMRNLSIALAVVINAFGDQGSDAALLISLAYIIQVQSAAWFVKFTHRLYGPKAVPA